MKKIGLLIIIIISILLFTLTVRGSAGNPTPKQIEFEQNSSGQPFETSQERSRYALILSLVNDHSFAIDNYASMGTPDIGAIKGHFYSFFPPAVSIMAIPLYLLGIKLGAAQLFTFSISTIFSLLTIIMIYLFCRKLKLHWSVAAFAAFSFGFATNAWGYSVTLYAHLVSSFLIILGLYIVLLIDNKYKAIKALVAWFLYAVAVFVDFPNLFIYLPIAGLAMLKIIDVMNLDEKIKIKLNWLVILTPLIFFLLMGVYGYYNQIHFGNPLKLSNTIPRVRDLKNVNLSIPESGGDATGALNTRNLLNGLGSFTISPDRGLIFYTPIALLFVFGIGFLKQNKKWVETGLIGVSAICIILYSMFADPYGGWAFGSRYMIAVLPELLILAAIGLQRFYKNILIKLLYSVVFMYSAAVSLLAPLTTNVIPPYIEARYLNLDSWFIINWRMIKANNLDSYFYNYILNRQLPGINYYIAILSLVIIFGLFTIWYKKEHYEDI